MPKISIQIPTTVGGFTYLAALLPALRQEAKEAEAEIIVIDNASRDGTTNYLSNYECTVIINTANLGFAKAHNQAAKIAQGEYLLLLNNDTAVTPGFLKAMLNCFEASEKIGIVGCCIMMLEGEKRVQHAGVMFTQDYVPYELGLPVPSVAPGIPVNDLRVKSIREVPSVTFACVMIKKECWDEVEGLDEEYINGWEDTDFVLKAREKGWKVWYTGEALIKHKKHGTPGRHNHEAENRQRYDNIWVNSGRAKTIVGDRREM